MAKVEVYSSAFCPYCVAAKRLLASKGVEYEHHAVDGDPALRREMETRSGRRTVPQIFIDGVHVGGFDDLAALDAERRLDPMLGLGAAG
ncbi:MAG: glutaredoxin 3 [Ectothiorhodospiraceae bacterium]|nr:glutaredoxin 3 [Chromatiales bacterium]MCP5153852.1 glutaredoxin 3 [Ectothiorhodospiraceae bacterium]